MPKFLYVYHGGKKPETPEEGEKVVAQWVKWLDGLGDAVVDGGNPVGLSKTVTATKVEEHGGANPASGYGIIAAPDMASAVTIAKGCPIHESGGSVEVAEIMEM